ncbi:glycosyltransferase family 4 protein [Chitinispirillales bacterium ANBcel5]|uniref:glycosyltransferase family 4 protein n=1 Tax=Cellulosispirillum alkaliphilum TaxID=3039283 RepID=UPI002A54F05A|nr:glycosyltransferase family 4 protein [Chitinispirillales bacterium ANBcel5]
MKRSIIYATRAPVPFPSASSINIVQTCQSFGGMGCEVLLYCDWKPWRLATQLYSINNYYGLGNVKFKSTRKPMIYGLYYKYLIKMAKTKESIVFTRDVETAIVTTSNNIRTILEVHSLCDEKKIRTLLNTKYTITIICITHKLSQHYNFGDTLNNVTVLPDPVNPKRFEGTQFTENLECGYVGSCFRGKGLFEIVAPLALKKKDAKIHVAGINNKRFHEEYNKCNKTPDNLKLYGRVKPKHVPAFFTKFSIALLPNQPEIILPNGADIGSYTSPIKLFEYMAAGKAIIASDVPVLKEVLKDQHNALLVKHDDVQEWANAITRLKCDIGLAKRLGMQAKRDVHEMYSYDIRCEKILDLID